MNPVEQRFNAVGTRIDEACSAAARERAKVRLLAVSKQHSAEAIRALHALGQVAFGENRAQEAIGKMAALSELPIEWHFIGPIQSNKTRDIARHFDWVQSVDRAKILRKLDAYRPDGLAPLQLCLQVNIDQEPQKAGINPEQLAELAALAQSLERVRLRGLMCIPTAGADAQATATSFQRMVALQEMLKEQGHCLDTLSMGMSGDLELAVMEGSTMVRVGTDLFGPRPPRTQAGTQL